MENTYQNKVAFCALYVMQNVYVNPMLGADPYHFTGVNLDDIDKTDYLLLKSLTSITDEDLIQVARLAHERPNHEFKVTRNKDIFYAQTEYDSVGINYFISMMPRYASVCATMNFYKTEKRDFRSHTINIGKVNLSASRPIAYIIIVDYLRSKGYAIPYMGLTVEKQIEYGWIKLTD